MHRRLEKVYYEVRLPRTSFADIGGLEREKALLRQMVCLPLARPGEVRAMGLVPPAGVLLWGPLGNGLAMLPEACALEVGASFVTVSGREILGKPEAVVEALSEAGRETPAVLYVSDLDWLAPQPGADYAWGPGGGDRGRPPALADRALTEVFIRELDRLQQSAGGRVAVLGGAYRVDVVDQALIRDRGRFNRKVFVPPPDAGARREILALHAGRIPCDGRLDLAEVAARAGGYVGWDLENVVRKAALEALDAGRRQITQADLLAALPLMQPWLSPEMEAGYRRIRAADCPHHYSF